MKMKEDNNDDRLEEVLREYVREAMLLHTQVANIGLPQTPWSTNSAFYKMKPHIFERDYVTKVLGIDLPLNESYPYSGPVYNQILKEQRFLEDFFRFSDDQAWLIVEQDMLREQDEDEEEDVSSWSWAGARRLAGDTKVAAAALKMMAKEPERIEKFVAAAMGSVKERYEDMKKFFDVLIEKGSEWKLGVFEKIGQIAKIFWDGVKAVYDKVADMSGWKKALAAGAAVVAVKSVWGKWGSILESLMEKFNEFADLVGGATNESYVHSMGLVSAVCGPGVDELNEFLGFGKKKEKKKKKDKWETMADDMEKDEKEEEGMTDEEKRQRRAKKKSDAADAQEKKSKKAEERLDTAEDIADDPSSVVDKAVGKAEKKGGWAVKMGKEHLSDEDKEKGTEIIEWLKEKFIEGFWKKSKKAIANLAARAAAAAATSGVSEYFVTLGKMYKSAGKALKALRPALQAAAEPSEIKDDQKAAGGEEEFWAQGTDKAGKGKRKKKKDKWATMVDDMDAEDEAGKGKEKKEEKNEALIRQVVREALFRAEPR